MKVLSQNSNRTPIKSTEATNSMMQEVLSLAQKQGATDASVAIHFDSGFSVDVRMGEVETVAFSEDKEVSITVYRGHRRGSASSTDSSPAALQAMVTAAMDIAEVSAADPCFGLADKDLIALHYPQLDLYHPWDIRVPDAIELAIDCEKQARALNSLIKNSDGVNLSTYNFKTGYANTAGFIGTVDSSRHNMSCSVIAAKAKEMQTDYDYTTARNAKDLSSIEDLARNAVERAVARLGAQKIKTQKAPVLFSSRLSRSLFSAMMGAISGSNLYRKNSFLLDAIGKRILPSGFKVYDQPHLLGALGSAPYDGEGLITRPNVWVDDGVLCQYVLNSYAARKMGLQTTANSGGVFNLTVDPTAGDLNDLLKKMDTGLLVTGLMGDAFNILTGDYSRGANGFWVEGGVIQYPVEEITIAGNLRDMLLQMVAIGNDIDPNTATRCGSVLIEEMMIAGA